MTEVEQLKKKHTIGGPAGRIGKIGSIGPIVPKSLAAIEDSGSKHQDSKQRQHSTSREYEGDADHGSKPRQRQSSNRVNKYMESTQQEQKQTFGPKRDEHCSAEKHNTKSRETAEPLPTTPITAPKISITTVSNNLGLTATPEPSQLGIESSLNQEIGLSTQSFMKYGTINEDGTEKPGAPKTGKAGGDGAGRDYLEINGNENTLVSEEDDKFRSVQASPEGSTDKEKPEENRKEHQTVVRIVGQYERSRRSASPDLDAAPAESYHFQVEKKKVPRYPKDTSRTVADDSILVSTQQSQVNKSQVSRQSRITKEPAIKIYKGQERSEEREKAIKGLHTNRYYHNLYSKQQPDYAQFGVPETPALELEDEQRKRKKKKDRDDEAQALSQAQHGGRSNFFHLRSNSMQGKRPHILSNPFQIPNISITIDSYTPMNPKQRRLEPLEVKFEPQYDLQMSTQR